MAKLAVLHHEEGVRVDPDCLVALYAELGEAGAERVLSRAMEELNARLTEMQRFVDEGRTAQLTRSARLLVKVAEQIGMPSFARVADDVVRATEVGDHAAQAATLARLIRIGDRSLNAVCDLRDLTV
ncbi:hypothetical protein OEZ60_09920 [Defluviimonas sp. WL0024]|uniref:Hpt domain-containing protein n=1 Tax=Albidovulum salinarum TaxID=2984153 RepID=A0ABT2X302_9RHOB|nr:hypothetical protein [Defluviimonas sp. WL0024]MCU9848325.1 hypothetical protein [Defluviimonas sp. WL0024]